MLTITIPTAGVLQTRWRETFTRGTPDVWLATKRDSLFASLTVFECELSNARAGSYAYDAQVQIVPPRGYRIVWECARPLPTVWPTKRACLRRGCLLPVNRPDLEARATALARGGFRREWLTARFRFGPANMPMPDLTPAVQAQVSAQAASWWGGVVHALATGGTCTVEDSEDGPILPGWHDWRWHGPLARYAPGGSGIHFQAGWQQSLDWLHLALLQAELAHERCWHALRPDGTHITADDYADGALKYAPGSGDPVNDQLPGFSGYDGIPLPYDPAHSIRGFRHAIALSEMMDSPMIRRSIASQAAQARLTYSERGAGPAYGYTPDNVRNLLTVAQASPGQGDGMKMGRMYGWAAWIIAQDGKVNGWTPGKRAWGQMLLDAAEAARMPTGICQRVTGSGPADVWWDPVFDTAQSFEAGIFSHGIVALARQMGVPEPVVLPTRSLCGPDAPKWAYYSEVGPPHFVAVAPHGRAPYPTITTGKGGSAVSPGDSAHMEALCALEASRGNLRALEWSATVGAVCSDSKAKRALLETRTDLRATSSLLAQYQKANP